MANNVCCPVPITSWALELNIALSRGFRSSHHLRLFYYLRTLLWTIVNFASIAV